MRMHICVLIRVQFNDNKAVTCTNATEGKNTINGRFYYHCISLHSSCPYVRFFDIPDFIPEEQKVIRAVELRDDIQTTSTL